MTPATIELRVNRRRAVRIKFRIKGYDLGLSGSAFRGQVRQYPEAGGDPIINLPQVTDTSNGIKLLGVEVVDGVPISILQMQISPSTMASGAIPPAGKAGTPGDPVIAWTGNYDLNISPAGGVEDVYARGAFIVEGVVTQ